MAVQVQINDHGVGAYLSAMPESITAAAKRAIARATANTHTKVTTGHSLHRRTGELMRSIHMNVKGNSLSTISGSVHSKGVRYAAIQETGGTITAKRAYRGVPGGPYLNIPLSGNQTGAGVMRQTARQVFQNGGNIVRSARGNYIVLSNIGTPMFVLKKQVTIPARLGMVAAADDEVPLLMSRLRDLMQGAIE